jgi:DNA polymerase I-like protein with 3'-5' exonuclease and polymerase domains
MEWTNIKDVPAMQVYKDYKDEFNYDFWGTVKNLQGNDDFLHYLLIAHETSRDYNEFLKYKLDKYSCIYPVFDIVGTVTSRIMITSPGIQFIKRKNRDIFVPRDGMSFLYADFHQFEPGILASLSGDLELIKIYNQEDVYNGLSLLLFKDKTHRSICKTLFLSYIYGMKHENIEKLVTNMAGVEAAKQGMNFFRSFTTVEGWKKNVIEKAEQQGFSSSVYGNCRYLNKNGISTNKEKRWIPNQIIQGTASYIFKRSLLNLAKVVTDVNYLIPMHDAILLEIPNPYLDAVKKTVNDVFIQEFKSICPAITPRVSFEDFSEE